MAEKVSTGITNISYEVTTNIISDACAIIETAQKSAFQAVNVALIKRNWLLGKRIAEEELVSDKRADNYGQKIIAVLSEQLTKNMERAFPKDLCISVWSFIGCSRTLCNR